MCIYRALDRLGLDQVPQPYFNEPGFESSIGTPEGDRNSFDYNAVIREATVKFAIIGAHKQRYPVCLLFISRGSFAIASARASNMLMS